MLFFFESVEVAQDACDVVSSFFVFDHVFILLAPFSVCLSLFGVVLSSCVSGRSDSSLSLFVIVLSWVCSFCVADALFVMAFSSLSLTSFAVAWFGRRVWVDRVEGAPGIFGRHRSCVRSS